MYEITFQNIFDFSTDKKFVALTAFQYQKALEHVQTKKVVISKEINAIHTELIIKEVKPI